MAKKTKPEITSQEEKLCATELVKNLPYSGITIEVPFIPPSVNDLYFNNRHGGRTLTKSGQVFKTRIKEYLTEHYLDEIQKLNPRSMYSMTMWFYLDKDDVFTKSYLENPKTQSPFKKRDVGNMEKVLVDCIKEFAFEDDCQIFHEVLWKMATTGGRKVVIRLDEVSPHTFIVGPNEYVTNINRKIEIYRSQAK